MPTVVIPAKFTDFDKVRVLVDETAKDAGLDDKDIYKVQLAVDEACSNIVEHGYGGEGKGKIECTCSNTGNGIEIVLRDWGTSFDPNGVPDPELTPSIEDMKLRGAGLFLMRKMMDEVQFINSSSQGNTLRLVKNKA